jgi:hypothetical protein
MPESGGGSDSIETLGELLGTIINILMGIGFAVGFLALAAGFLQLVLSGGDPKATEKGFSTIKWSIIALVLTVLVFILKSILLNLFGVTDPNVIQPVPNI